MLCLKQSIFYFAIAPRSASAERRLRDTALAIHLQIRLEQYPKK